MEILLKQEMEIQKKLTDLFEETLSKIKNINKDLDEETNKLLTNTVLTFSDLITNRKTDYKFDLINLQILMVKLVYIFNMHLLELKN